MQDTFSVELLTPEGRRLPTVADGSEQWVVGEQGQEFTLTVAMTNTSQSDYKVSLKIDGQDVGYALIMHGNQFQANATFQGWLQSAGGFAVMGTTNTHYRAFKFGRCTPAEDAETVQSLAEIKAGVIRVQLQRVVAMGQRGAYTNLAAAGPGSAATDVKLPDHKKGFLAPGLKAEAGSVKAAATHWNTTIYQPVGEAPPITLKYDCSEALLMRKVLNPRLPAHRAILRHSANPNIRNAVPPEADEEEEQDEDAGDTDEAISRPAAAAARARGRQAAAAAAAAGAAGGAAGSSKVKREGGGVKREREEGGEDDVPRSATAFTIDLTEQQPAKPMQVNGRELNADELAVCDLADSDDEGAPKWGVAKKQQVALDA